MNKAPVSETAAKLAKLKEMYVPSDPLKVKLEKRASIRILKK